MTTPITTFTTDSQMHNNIMATGSRDRPPMLATGRYAQWRSLFLRYIDRKTNGDALRKCILEEKEAIHMILTGIGDEIYSTVDACNTTHEMWEAIERLQQGESLNIQDVKTNLFWEFGKFTSHDGESIESYYSRFYKLMNEMIRNNLTVDKMQKEVNELRAERIAKNKNVDTTPRYKNDNQSGQFRIMRTYGREKPKRVKDSTYHKEKMLLCKQAEKGVQLQAEQFDWIADTDEEIDEQEYHTILDMTVVANETVDSNVILDSPDMCDNDIQNDQNDVECDDERVALANLIANLKLDVDENKNIQKQLKKANAP
ncbi:hypothetical protein Tco_1540863 [Tanacetum coccineum]